MEWGVEGGGVRVGRLDWRPGALVAKPTEPAEPIRLNSFESLNPKP